MERRNWSLAQEFITVKRTFFCSVCTDPVIKLPLVQAINNPVNFM